MSESNVLDLGNQIDSMLADDGNNGESTKEIERLEERQIDVRKMPYVPDKPEKPKNVKSAARGQGQNWVSRLMGSAEKAIIYKRKENGELSLCGNYTFKDVARSNSMDLFIKDYLVPAYGYGSYDVHVISADGSEKSVGESRQEPPLDHNPGNVDPSVVFKNLTDVQLRLAQEAERKQQEQTAAANAQFESMLKMMTLLGVKPGEKQGGDSMMPMMLMMMMQQNAPKPADTTTASLQAIQDAFRTALDQQRPAMFPPALPPMPSEQPNSTAEMVKELAVALKPVGPNPVEFIEKMAPLVLPLLKKDGMKLTELLPLLPVVQNVLKDLSGANAISELRQELRDLRDKRHDGNDLGNIVSQFRLIKELGQEFNPGPRSSDSFWDFMRDFMQSLPDTTNAIGDLVSKINMSNPKKGVGPSKPAPQLTQPEPEVDDDEEVELHYPKGFKAHIDKISASQNDGEMIGNVLQAFAFLGQHDGWKQHLGTMLMKARGGDKNTVLEFIKSFLEGLRDGEMINEEVAGKAIAAFEQNIDKVIDWAKGGVKKRAGAKKADEQKKDTP